MSVFVWDGLNSRHRGPKKTAKDVEILFEGVFLVNIYTSRIFKKSLKNIVIFTYERMKKDLLKTHTDR